MSDQNILNCLGAVRIHYGGQMKKSLWFFLLIALGAASWAWSGAINEKLSNENQHENYEPAMVLFQAARTKEIQTTKAMQAAARWLPVDKDETRAHFLNETGLALLDAGKYSQAKAPLARALAIREKVLGPEHLKVVTSLNNLALLYDNQGRYEEAAPLYQRALSIREKVLGPEHPDVATSLNNLALLYDVQGRHEEAEPLYQRALSIREKVLGSEHSHVAASLNNLAAHYNAQERYEEAEPLFQRSQAIWEKVFVPEHADVVIVRENQATH